eukprot:CAMPEP_0185594300 /NCGR_PEP_ID=MMETSP0434-20130131/74404_1 /TAXON_ID=626734 ORGANISM="Favella taraikaensis, Strain Fe Narragansett Bay" /NCGR_SAMPLE_ID=MMETSP0434 /ASSEMBLY_ACC=CAM_ASM_000379 /LENGTH=64 /DNA_ID=CAMNT_0028221521 /DNA_START=235 /DNA_END=426 /DNA_ORIENTATION=-
MAAPPASPTHVKAAKSERAPVGNNSANISSVVESAESDRRVLESVSKSLDCLQDIEDDAVEERH